ncbi:MAG: helix-turn-helix domain containing protein [Myxococcota bacterium]|nr:helix-turn-helix domain containing protein [Myxococcota bacterium]
MAKVRSGKQSAEPTGREALIEAARALFAERGIEGVSIRELGRAADQRNNNAVQYHFGNREALLLAVLAPHNQRVGARRAALLDEVEAETAPSTRSLASALVRPSAAMLEDAAGRNYLRIVAELIADPVNLRRQGPFDDTELGRWDRLAKRLMAETTLPLHRRFSAMNLCFSELGRRARARRRGDHRLFVSDLLDLVTGLLSAEVSGETLGLLGERERDHDATATPPARTPRARAKRS